MNKSVEIAIDKMNQADEAAGSSAQRRAIFAKLGGGGKAKTKFSNVRMGGRDNVKASPTRRIRLLSGVGGGVNKRGSEVRKLLANLTRDARRGSKPRKDSFFNRKDYKEGSGSRITPKGKRIYANVMSWKGSSGKQKGKLYREVNIGNLRSMF